MAIAEELVIRAEKVDLLDHLAAQVCLARADKALSAH